MSNSPDFHYDLIVIGGGRAADLAFAVAAAGQKVALIERDRLGGTCANRGCVPSKLLIGYAETARRIQEADRHFIKASIEEIDRAQIFAEVNAWVNSVDERYAARAPENLTLIRGHAEFVADKQVRVPATGLTLSAEKLVISVGTRPRPHPYPNVPAWSSDDLFPLQGKVPQSLAIIGGGFIGCELGAFFSAIGIPTTLYVRGQHLLPKEDAEIGAIFRDEFTRHTPTKFGHSLRNLTHDGTTFHTTFATENGEETAAFDQVLFTTGRISNADQLNLATTAIETDQRGFIVTDDHLRTAVPGVYAAGDVAGRFILRHAAAHDMTYLRRVLLEGFDGPVEYGAMPHAVFSDPEIAAVGASEEELKARSVPYLRVMQNWKASARAMASRLDYPRIKLLVSPADFSILGCHLIGPDASTLIHQILMLMHVENDIRRIPEMIHIHPALSEIFLSAAQEAIAAASTP